MPGTASLTDKQTLQILNANKPQFDQVQQVLDISLKADAIIADPNSFPQSSTSLGTTPQSQGLSLVDATDALPEGEVDTVSFAQTRSDFDTVDTGTVRTSADHLAFADLDAPGALSQSSTLRLQIGVQSLALQAHLNYDVLSLLQSQPLSTLPRQV